MSISGPLWRGVSLSCEETLDLSQTSREAIKDKAMIRKLGYCILCMPIMTKLLRLRLQEGHLTCRSWAVSSPQKLSILRRLLETIF